MPQPTIGRIVQYTLASHDVEMIERRRAALATQLGVHPASLGNSAEAGQVFPAQIVRVFHPSSTTANLRVSLDGYDVLWVTSRAEGDQPGTWAWPART